MSVTVTQTTGSPVSITIPSGTLAANLASIYSLEPSSFIQLCQSAMTTVANGVLGEDASVTNFANRRDYAREVILNPVATTASAIWSITADGVTGYASTDQQLINRIIAIWPILSFGD